MDHLLSKESSTCVGGFLVDALVRCVFSFVVRVQVPLWGLGLVVVFEKLIASMSIFVVLFLKL